MNHKRGRSANRRAGCKMCKPWKAVGGSRKNRNKSMRIADAQLSDEIFNRV